MVRLAGMIDRVLSIFKKPQSLEDLQFAFAESASHLNRLSLAQGLFDANRLTDAREHFIGVLKQRTEDTDAIFGLALCQLELGNMEEGIDGLESLIELKPGYHDYEAFPHLATALHATGKDERCLEMLRALAKNQPRLTHVLLLSKYLAKTGDVDEACAQLETGLRHYDEAPKHVRREYSRAARAGHRMLEAMRNQ